MFNQSVFHNIAQSKPDASLDEVITAAKLAGAHDFILKMPLGYDSLIAEGVNHYQAASANVLLLLAHY